MGRSPCWPWPPAGTRCPLPRGRRAGQVGGRADGRRARAGDAVTGLRIEASKGGLVEIAVTDAGSGRPLAQARVGARLLPKARGSVRLHASEESFTAVSDAQGVAHIRLCPGTYAVSGVSCDGYSSAGFRRTVAVEEGGTARAALTFERNARGVVRDPQGRPVAGAQVKIVAGGRAEVTSDDQGRFEIAWEGTNQLHRKPAFWLVARHEQRDLAAIVAIGKEANLLDVRLAPCVTLTGRIVDPNGRGVGRAWVYVTLDVPDWGDTPLREEHIQADDDGKFEIPALAAGGPVCDPRLCRCVWQQCRRRRGRGRREPLARSWGDRAPGGKPLCFRPGRRSAEQARRLRHDLRLRPRSTRSTDRANRRRGQVHSRRRLRRSDRLRVDPYGRGDRLWAQVSAPGDAVGVEVVAR